MMVQSYWLSIALCKFIWLLKVVKLLQLVVFGNFRLFVFFLMKLLLVVGSRNIAGNVFGLGVGGLLKPKNVCQHQRLLIAQMFLFALSAH
jgi:hypothetical protein